MRLLPCGSDAVLVEFDDLAAVRSAAAALRAQPPPGVLEVVPAARTVMLILRHGTDPAALLDPLRALPSAAPDEAAGELITIPVVYDGPDVADVARLTGRSVERVIAEHSAATWSVAFGGFVPGFGYLVADDQPRVPRRASPRPSVPAGAVGVAGEFSGVYPRRSPGGWQLLGRTDVVLWDAQRDPPALLRPGVRVRFQPVAAR